MLIMLRIKKDAENQGLNPKDNRVGFRVLYKLGLAEAHSNLIKEL